MNNTIKNSVHLVGNVGKEVQLLSFDNGNKKASLIMATNEYYTNTKGEKVKQTDWHHLVAWGKTAEEMATSLSKGNEIAIHGKINNRTYVDKTGSTKYITEIVVSEFLKIAKAQPVVVEAVPF
jgi:single-strand DNA-binding protein